MNVLGISCYYHDAGAALVRDGQLIAAAEEERFTRKKHDFDFPARAIEYCLKEAGITIDRVDHVGFYEKPLVKFNRILESILACWPLTYQAWLKALPLWLGHRLHMGREIQEKLGTDKEILYCQHHLSHAASAFLVSPYREAAIITADGVGEWTTTAWGVGKGTDIEMFKEIRFPHSVGLLFSAITAYLGFRVNDAEWKVMGLAPYGKPTYVDKFREVVDVKDDGSIRLNLKYFAHPYSATRTINHRWEELFGQPQRPKETELNDFHRDIAHSGQKIVEEIMVKMATHVHRQTGMESVCLAGGVGLNCVANWRILQESGFRNIFIQPAAGDSGGALGTAFYIYNTVLKNPRVFEMKHALWGPSYSDDEIRNVLDAAEASYETLRDETELLRRTARLIADGKVVGWFQGRLEFGPRALGSRSLLADPRNPKMKDIINAKVKFREAFRPFAPAVLKEHAHEYFEMPAGMDAPYMLLVPKVRVEKHSVLPAVTHQDGTGRVQTVTDADNGRYYRLIREFGRLTGVPVVINTSFNVRGEPIVCTPRDAYNTFVNTGIDVLVMGDHVLTEKPGAVDFDAGMKRSIALESSSLLEAKAVTR
ncbi:MAG: carbamoyltransferase [Planctomycetes bacterium]|nr:carbamoyltransferase [Planctomycetota bacterium]